MGKRHDDSIVVKGVAFNLEDPDQNGLFEHAMKRKNFSAYIKRLIQRDKEGAVVRQYEMQVQQPEPEMPSLDDGLMLSVV